METIKINKLLTDEEILKNRKNSISKGKLLSVFHELKKITHHRISSDVRSLLMSLELITEEEFIKKYIPAKTNEKKQAFIRKQKDCLDMWLHGRVYQTVSQSNLCQ